MAVMLYVLKFVFILNLNNHVTCFCFFKKAMTLINRPLISSISTESRSQFWAVIGFWNLYQ